MALKIELKPFERIIIGESLVTEFGYESSLHH